MCNRYAPPRPDEIIERWRPRQMNVNYLPGPVFPRGTGPFIRAARDGADAGRELAVGQWALVPWFAKSRTLAYSTNNGRFEGAESKASFKQPWLRGQRRIIPAEWFDESCWESGRNVWWRLRRADAQPWGLAGLWNTWIDKGTGEVVETMLTLNADAHPLMSRMHKSDPKLGPDQQDKRSMVAIELADTDAWLFGTVEVARSLVRLPLVRLPLVDVFEAGPT